MFWRIMRLIPISIMLLSNGVLLTMFMMGSMTRIYASYSLQYPVLIGIASLIVVIIYSVVRRKHGFHREKITPALWPTI
jgi:phosphoglycerol transferase MdoB-like AlkP superfamily enzyme